MVNSYDRKWNGDIRISDDVAGEDVEDGSDSQSELLGQPVIYGRLTLGESLCPGNVEAGIIEVRRVNPNKREGFPFVGGGKPDESFGGLLDFRRTLDFAQIIALEYRREFTVANNDVCVAPELVDVIGKLASCACCGQIYSYEQGDPEYDR